MRAGNGRLSREPAKHHDGKNGQYQDYGDQRQGGERPAPHHGLAAG
ncbi:MAG TPA: hypothetical protein VIN12_06500 [Candidatus Dormibacteraeota bacterium]|jgi:hypothetical protein